MRKVYTALAALGVMLTVNAQTISYSLDLSYRGKGYQFNNPNPTTFSTGSADAIVLNNDGSEYVGIKQLFAGDNYAITVLAKNKANGTRDSSFATNGIATENMQRNIRVNDIAFLNGNKIYCSGSGWGGYVWSNGNMAPQVYAGGVIAPTEISYDGCKHNDTTVVQVGDVNVIAFFKDNGNTTTNLYANDGYDYVTYPSLSANTPTLQRVASVLNGNYYVAGLVDSFAFIAKYKARTFLLDSTWGTNGVATIKVQIASGNKFTDLKVQPDGKLVAIFNGLLPGASSNSYIYRFTASGALDNTFGTNGIVQKVGSRVAFLPNGEIALLYEYDFNSVHEAGIIHLSNNGTELSVKGFNLPTASGYNQENTPLALSANAAGDIAICGTVMDSANGVNKFFTMRLKRNVCNIVASVSGIGGTTATINYSNIAFPATVTVYIPESSAPFTQNVSSGSSVQATGLTPNTTYTASITDANGCIWETTFTTTNGTVDIKEMANTNVALYPNPVSAQLSIEASESIAKVSVFNIQGQKMKEITSNYSQVDITELPSGFYLAQINTLTNQTIVMKFTKQ